MRFTRTALFALGLSLLALPAFADGFLKVDGVAGDSADDKHKGEIDIQSVTTQPSLPSSERRVAMQDFHFTKKIDKASPIFARLAGKNTALPGIATVVFDSPKQPANPKDKHELLKFELHDVLVSSYRTDPKSSPAVENVDLTARSFEVYSRDGELGAWVKRDAAAMARDYPSVFLPARR